MASVKTAVSLQEPLLEWVDAQARKRRVSRSRLISLAIEDYRSRQETAELMARINEVCAEGEDEETVRFRRHALLHARRVLEGER
jgi:metal-responsive CopG/Arc/MetJ family transcriptional regulator